MNSNELREEWLIFLLGCANKVTPVFKIGEPETGYKPVQTLNGRRNAASIWAEENQVRIAFTIDQNSELENKSKTLDPSSEYEPEPKHLVISTSESPVGEVADLLSEIMVEAARRAAPAVGETDKRKVEKPTGAPL